MYRYIGSKNLIISVCLLFLALGSNITSATTLRPLDLEQLSTRAALILYGEVRRNEVKFDPQSGQTVTFTEFDVIEPIKGTIATHSYTIKQIGGFNPQTRILYRVHGVPAFTVGSRYVVFLPEKSSLGFSSPLGLHQGAFSVETVDNETIVSNGARNLGLNANQQQRVQIPLAGDASRPAQYRLQDFINTVRAYNTK